MADVPVSGSIDPATFPFLLAGLHRKGATGSLKVAGPSYQKALYFRSGRILFGSSNDPRDQLGAILIESGKITAEQLDDVSGKVGPGSPLAKVLADTGFVNQRELSEAARAKVERILSDVLGYDSGSFEFEDGVLPKGAVDLKLSTERVIVAAVRRIADRNFVLRYIDGMEAVLRPTADMATRVAEIETDTSGVTYYLDGARTLKEAASLARLDEFEAAKIACALLFLGAVERVSMVDLGAVAAAAQAPTGGDEPIILDTEPPPSIIGMEPGTSPFAAARPAESISMTSEEPPVVMMEPEPTVLMAPDDGARPGTPPAEEPIPSFEPPIPPPGKGRRVYDVPVPAIEPTPAIVFDAPAPSPVRSPSRPSDDDLKALDQLLNPRLEGPRADLARSAEESRATVRSSARPAPARTARRSAPPSRAPLALGIAAAIAVAAGAGWFFLLRPREAASDARADAPAMPADTAPVGRAAGPPTMAPAGTAPTTTATPVPAPTDARALLQGGRFPEAARRFASDLRSAGAGAATVQLFVACSPETVQKAVDAVGTRDLVIVPTRFNGKDCYRLCWGIHPSPQQAVMALRTLPDYFRQGGVSPKVMPAAEIAP